MRIYLSSCTRCAVILEPDAPTGWPRAMAPPLTLSLERSSPISFSTARVWAAKASFTYKIQQLQFVSLFIWYLYPLCIGLHWLFKEHVFNLSHWHQWCQPWTVIGAIGHHGFYNCYSRHIILLVIFFSSNSVRNFFSSNSVRNIYIML